MQSFWSSCGYVAAKWCALVSLDSADKWAPAAGGWCTAPSGGARCSMQSGCCGARMRAPAGNDAPQNLRSICPDVSPQVGVSAAARAGESHCDGAASVKGAGQLQRSFTFCIFFLIISFNIYFQLLEQQWSDLTWLLICKTLPRFV